MQTLSHVMQLVMSLEFLLSGHVKSTILRETKIVGCLLNHEVEKNFRTINFRDMYEQR